jgi:hypothetical protein
MSTPDASEGSTSAPDDETARELAALRAEVARLNSYEDIRQLVYRYAIAADARDIDTIAEMFADEANFGSEYGMGATGAYSFYDESLAGIRVMILNVGNVLIELDDDDRAHGVVYCRGELEVGDEWVVQQIVYRDRYVRQRGSWRFRSRQHLLFYGADMLTRPINLPPVDKPDVFKGRGSAPGIWPTFGAFWERHGGMPPEGKRADS